MTAPLVSREQARRIDALAVSKYHMLSAMLMESAGRGVADQLCGLGISGPVAVCCGGGNNGGDGYVVARYLDARGHAVRVLALSDPSRLRGDAALNFRIVEQSGIAVRLSTDGALASSLSGCQWVVDALLGTGATGPPRSPFAEAIEAINAAGTRVLAVDIPSGLDCDSGRAAQTTIRAEMTCTFVAAKPGFFVGEAAQYTGRVHVIDIGVPRRLLAEVLGGSPAV
jgi:NAD(P)H-hydrate epimerase